LTLERKNFLPNNIKLNKNILDNCREDYLFSISHFPNTAPSTRAPILHSLGFTVLQDLSAVKIQSIYRGYRIRKLVFKHLQFIQACLVIQKIWRGYRTRNWLKKMRSNSILNAVWLKLEQETQKRRLLEEAVRFLWFQVQQLKVQNNQEPNQIQSEQSNMEIEDMLSKKISIINTT